MELKRYADATPFMFGDFELRELTPDAYNEIASCTLPKGLIWSPPVLAGGMIFIRGMNGELYAVRG